MAGENGKGVELVDTIVLKYNRVTDMLSVDQDVHSADLALDMLGRARRWFEFQQRKAQALQIQAEARQQAADAAIAEALRKTR